MGYYNYYPILYTISLGMVLYSLYKRDIVGYYSSPTKWFVLYSLILGHVKAGSAALIASTTFENG